MSTIARTVSFGMRPGAASKYHNKPTMRAGRLFASKREADHFLHLKAREGAGEVRNIRLQVRFNLEVAGRHICRYHADFVYEELREGAWVEVVDDTKGFRTAVYNLKKKLMAACLGIEIRET